MVIDLLYGYNRPYGITSILLIEATSGERKSLDFSRATGYTNIEVKNNADRY
jgi:hypothetical protein